MVGVTEVMDTQGWVSFSGLARGSKAPKFGIFSFKQLLKPSPFSSIFAKSEMPMPQKDASSYPKNAVTWLRFDPIPKASTTHARQRKCQCNSQTGRGISGPGLGMGVYGRGDLGIPPHLVKFENHYLISLSPKGIKVSKIVHESIEDWWDWDWLATATGTGW